MCAWYNKKAAKAMAEMVEKLKAESKAKAEAEEKLRAEIEAKAAIERKVKAEAENLLISQYNKYSAQVERVEKKAKEEIEKARAEVEQAEQRIRSYSTALAHAEEKLRDIQERVKQEAIARVQAEESLRSERQERERVEAQIQEVIAEAKAEENGRSSESASAQAEEKVNETQEQIENEVITKAKSDPQAKMEEDQNVYVFPEDSAKPSKRAGRHLFDASNIKRKFILILVIAIFSAITFALSVPNKPTESKPGGGGIKIKRPARAALTALTGSDADEKKAGSSAKAEAGIKSSINSSGGSTNTAALNYKSSNDIAYKGDGKEKRLPALEFKTVTIKAYPLPLKITASANSENNIVQFSDNKRSEAEAGSGISFEFSDVSLDVKAAIQSVVLFVEHFEEERFGQGKLEWAIGTGRPVKPVVWTTMEAPVHEGESKETVDAWDITSAVNTVERINSLQLQVKNNSDAANGKSFVDYVYVVVQYDLEHLKK